MENNHLERKLAAVLYADVAGYSRLTGEDEEGTHRRLSEYLNLLSACIERHSGRVVHYAGDAVLADFRTVTNSMMCADTIQRELGDRNQDLPDDRRVQFRIGINLGEVIVDRDDIYGDGVNVAARLESLAEPGGICISESVYSAIGNKLPLEYDFMGEQEVKNIDKPVLAYRVLSAFVAPEAAGEGGGLDRSPQVSVAVLPFENRTADPEQAYFADGISEDIIIALSKFRWFSVIARNSMFSYKGSSADWKRVARELNAKYVLEGSVRTASKRVRITVQLIDADTGNRVWANRYDRAMEDVFAVQDEITRNIVAAIEPELFATEGRRFERKNPESLDAWGLFLRAQAHIYAGTREENLKAQELAETAIELDPGSPHGYRSLAWSKYLAGRLGWAPWRGEEFERALDAAMKAVDIDPKDAFSHKVLGALHLAYGRIDMAKQELGISIGLNPSSPFAHMLMGITLVYDGRSEECLDEIAEAEHISPRDPMLPYLRCTQGLAYWAMGDYPRALEPATYARQHTQRWVPCRVTSTACHEALGRHDEATRALAEALEIAPALTIEALRARLVFRDPAVFEKVVDPLRAAGLPES